MYYKTISIDKTGHREGVRVCVRGLGGGLFGLEQNAIFLSSDDIRPKSESIGYIIRCTFENYFKPCIEFLLNLVLVQVSLKY